MEFGDAFGQLLEYLVARGMWSGLTWIVRTSAGGIKRWRRTRRLLRARKSRKPRKPRKRIQRRPK